MKESGENYLETIYTLFKAKGVVKAIDISNALGVSRPSVFRASQALKDEGLITQEYYGNIILTPKGKKKAEEILSKHKNITKFLMHSLSLDHDEAELNACKIEHIITPEAMNKIIDYLKKYSL